MTATIITERLDSTQLSRAVELLQRGELVAFPTETVYGLGASIFLPEAIKAIFKVKGRPSDNPLIAHVSSLEQVQSIAQAIPSSFYRLAEVYFPGPLTVVLQRQSHVPAIVSAGLNTIAVRMPSHPIARQLIALMGTPLVAPSANLSGKPSATQMEHVIEDFEGKIAAVVEGEKTEIGIESTVISLVSEEPVLLRPGAVTKEDLEKVLGRPLGLAPACPEGPVSSPGMKYRHYCPQTPIKLFYTLKELKNYLAEQDFRLPRMFLAVDPQNIDYPNLAHYGLSTQEFYALLRFADKQAYSEILILCNSDLQKNSGLMNRVLRASGTL
jgi:L-threonylcarbamoyladenylate synthase